MFATNPTSLSLNSTLIGFFNKLTNSLNVDELLKLMMNNKNCSEVKNFYLNN